MTTSCTASTVNTACKDFATRACAGGAVNCGSFTYNGTTYSNKCYCVSCGNGVTTQFKSTDGKIMGCGCSKSLCTASNSTNSSTHLVTTSYSSSKSLYCFRAIGDVTPTAVGSYCSSLSKSYSCASGYGALASPTSTTTCYSCTGNLYFGTGTPSSTPTAFSGTQCNPTTYQLDTRQWKAYNANSWSGATAAPKSVATSYCSPCASDCWYSSGNVISYGSTCAGIILYGCPVTYGTSSCSTSASGCANATKSGVKCVCKAGYYGSAANSCSSCPTVSDTKVSGTGVTSSAGTTSVTGCCIASGSVYKDSVGHTYDYTGNCCAQ